MQIAMMRHVVMGGLMRQSRAPIKSAGDSRGHLSRPRFRTEAGAP
jgi:hypothetical protein